MNKLFTLLLIITISANISAQTQVSGNQSGIWLAADSPYEVIGEITVPAGQTLTIEAGVKVNFQGYYKFNVTGNLHAIGTETDSIFFTTDNQSTGWGGIRIDVANYDDIIALSYCRIEYGKTEVSYDYPNQHGGGLALLTSNAVISHCVFADNDATGNDNGMGGAIYAINTGDISGETLTYITDCKFIRNHAYGEGGAIKFTSDGYTEIKECEFTDNNCGLGGGAISFYGVVGTTMIQCLFANNYSSSSGGAIHMLGFSNTMFFKNCTFTKNESVNGDGGGVYIVNGAIDFVNCIAYNNFALYGGTAGDNVYVNPDGSTAEINYCNMIMPEYGATGSNNINEDPLFINALNGDFHLQETSPCIDAGTDIGIPYNGDAPDMGCYEYGWDAPYVISYLPGQNAVDVEFTAVVSVTFNEDITEVDLSTVEIRDAENVQVSGVSAQIETDSRTLTISHDDFEENITYTVFIPSNSIQNSATIGNELITWSFTTETGNNISLLNSEVNIYPNPTNGQFIVEFDGIEIGSDIEIFITDVTGKLIYNSVNISNKINIDISNCTSGMYFIKISSNKSIFTEKIIIK